VPRLELAHRPPAAPPPPPPRRKARNDLQPPALIRITASMTQLRNPRPARSATSTRLTSVAVLTATVAVPPGAPEPPCRRLLTKSSPTSNVATSRTGDRGLARRPRMRGQPAPAPPPQASRSPGPPPCHHRTARPARTDPGGVRAAGRAHTGMHARLGGGRQAEHGSITSADLVRGSSVDIWADVAAASKEVAVDVWQCLVIQLKQP